MNDNNINNENNNINENINSEEQTLRPVRPSRPAHRSTLNLPINEQPVSHIEPESEKPETIDIPEAADKPEEPENIPVSPTVPEPKKTSEPTVSLEPIIIPERKKAPEPKKIQQPKKAREPEKKPVKKKAPAAKAQNGTQATGNKPPVRRNKRADRSKAIVTAVICLLALALIVAVIAVAGSGKRSDGKNKQMTEKTTEAPAVKSTTAEPAKINSKVSFAAVGDNIIYQAGFTDAKNRAVAGGREYNFAPLYTDVKEMIESADLAYVNQETQMAGKEYGYSDYPMFNSPRDLAYDLIETGFDIVSTANNHMLDMGTDGLESTIRFWNSLDGVTLVGGYLDEEDFMNIRVIEKNDIKISMIAFTYSANGFTVRDGSDLYVPFIDEDDIKRQMEAANKVSDVQLVSIHWGNENVFDPSDEQIETAQLLCDLGADVIIGAHPHVIQPIEWLTGKDGNKTLCIYSLGDFVAVMMRASNMLGGVMTFDIVRDGDDFTIEDPVFNPTVCHFGPSYYNCHIYFLSDFTDDLAATFANVYGVTADKDDLADIVTSTISPEFLPDYLKD